LTFKVNNKLNLILRSIDKKASYFEVKKNQLIYQGKEGKHFFDFFDSKEELNFGLRKFINKIKNLYFDEGIKIQSVNLELLIKEIMLLGLSIKDFKHYNINYLNTRGLDYLKSERNLNKIYDTMRSPLSAISYENFLKNLVRLGIASVEDDLDTYNSNIIVGRNFNSIKED